ncbi:MAG: hypothetical protein ABIK83_06675 [Candidatus Zixiibacteriota bacterium]
MERILTATRILHCGIRYSNAGLEAFAGPEIAMLVTEVFGELHKNNLPEEEFLLAVKKMFDRKDCTLPSEFEIPVHPRIEHILSEIRADDFYRADPRIAEISDFRQESVLEDFVYCLTQLFHADSERYRRIAATIESG